MNALFGKSIGSEAGNENSPWRFSCITQTDAKSTSKPRQLDVECDDWLRVWFICSAV